MSLLVKSISYCRQIATRLANQTTKLPQHKQVFGSVTVDSNISQAAVTSTVRWNSSSSKNPYKFETPSPYKKSGTTRHGYKQLFFDGGRLPRGLSDPLYSQKPFRPKDRWNKKHALFGQNDYIDILGDSGVRPADLIQGPKWIRAFNGNEMQRLVRRLNFEGHKIKQLYPSKYHIMQKRVRFLYKKYNFRRGKKLPGPDKWQP